METRSGPRWLPLAFLLPLLFLPGYAAGSSIGDGDPGVPARIRALEGTAMVQREREQDRVEATINTPVLPGDRIEVEGGPLEIQLPDGSLLWIDAGTRVQLVAIRTPGDESGEGTVVTLEEGDLEVDIHSNAAQQAELRIDTPQSSVYLMNRGRFGVETAEGVTSVTSYRGVAELAGDEGSILVRSGQQSRVESGGTPDDPWPVNTLRRDSFGDWCEMRAGSYVTDSSSEDREFVEAVPVPVRHFVPELDSYGAWQYVATFGWVWRPTVIQVGWRPYYNGHWSWCSSSWVWVSSEPWGWLPYHYGRWSWITPAGWVWIPGAAYSGAWVSWAVTPSYVGWCPLDYHNRPAYVAMGYNNTANQFGAGWNFLPLNRWGSKNLERAIVRADRVPQVQEAVTTRSLPHFDERQTRMHPEVLQRVVRESSSGPGLEGRDPAGGNAFIQEERRERAVPRGVGRPPLRVDVGHRRIADGSGGPGQSPSDSRQPRAVDSRPGVRSVEPMRGNQTTGKFPLSPRPKGLESKPPLAGPPVARPRVPSDDPSRRVLNRILGGSSTAPTSPTNNDPVRDRMGNNRPSAAAGASPSPSMRRGEAHPQPSPPTRSTVPPRNKNDETKQKKDKP